MRAGGEIDRGRFGLQFGFKKVLANNWPYHLGEPFNSSMNMQGNLLTIVIGDQAFTCKVILFIL